MTTIPLSDDSVEAAGVEVLVGISKNLTEDEIARAAITAYLQAEIKAGRARPAITKWNGALFHKHTEDADALILSLEPSK